MKKFTFLLLFLVGSTLGVLAQTITHSNSQNISDGDWLTCQSGEISTDNNFYRSFVLEDFGIVGPWTVSSVEIGVDQLFFGPAEGYPVTVTLYTTDAPFPGGTLTEIATATELLPELALEVYSFPIVAAVPAGSELVVKVAIFEDDVTSFLLGCNMEGETAPWWLQAEECSVPDPTSNQDLGFPNAWVLNVVGAAGDAVSNPSDCGLAIDITDNACPDNDTTNIAVTGVPGGVMGDNLLLTDVNIVILHTWDADLEIRLQSPSGVMVDLSISNGGSGDNFGDTLGGCVDVTNFNMDAATAIGDGDPPFIGSFIPDGDFADFNDGGNANGLWSLHICDGAAGDAGTLEFVELVFTQPCPDPSDLVASNVTDVSADLGWTENGSATDWEVEIVLAGDAPTGVGTATTDNPYAATGLSGSTDYEFYVRADCGGGEMSSWIGPGSFTTPLGTLTNPSACGLGLVLSDANCPDTDDFNIEVTGAAGPLTDVDLVIAHTWDADLFITLTSPGGTTVDLFLGHGGSDDNIGDPNDPNCDAVMNLNMDAATAVADGTAPFIGSFIPDGNLADLDDGGGFNGIWTLHICDGAGGDQGTLMYVALGFNGAGCAAPSNLTADVTSATSADLGWDDNAGASEWEVEIVAAGDTPTGSGTVTGDNPYSATGLTPSTAYEFYVRANCGGSESDWAGPMMFETPVGINDLSFENNVSVYPNPVSSLLTVEVNADLAAGAVISLVSLQGKVIYNETVQNSVSEYRTEIDMTSFAKGIYILKLEDENSSIQKRIVLQ